MTDPVAALFSGAPEVGRTDALLVQQRGEVVLERYGDEAGPDATLRSWSMAKSMLHAVVGLLVADGRLALDAPAPVAAWSDPDDPRHAITLRHLLEMRPGLQWAEVYELGGASDVVEMLFSNDFSAVDDTAAFAAGKPLAAAPGTVFTYSSGTSNIIAGIVGDEVGRGEPYRQLLRDRLFGPLGMASATPTFDPSGTWIASSYCYCTARDFARFGQLYLDGGVVGGTRLLPAAWVADAARTISHDPEDGKGYSMHWWQHWAERFPGSFNAAGYEGQYIAVVPSLELVAVRLGQTTEERHDLERLVGDLIATFA
jgi:CubicO group peptidase (beta-lactamase class C family)